MQLVINGMARPVPDGLTVAALIEHLGVQSDRVAVELNREIVPKGKWSATNLGENDRLEIVHFVGGGKSP
jgi:thiamine biosynthesis protein ThiS